jgi:CRP-like cAMP-binding protein
LLASLPEPEQRRLAAFMEPLDLPIRHLLYEQDTPATDVYFITAGLASIVTPMQDGTAVETMIVGPEGCVGVPPFLGIQRQHARAFQQIAGSGLRMSTTDFLRETSPPGALRTAVNAFVGLSLSQAMQTAACNRLHEAEARCARWLLLCAQRLNRHDLPLTHEFLSQMLGTTRPSVTATIGKLEEQHLVEQSRGRIRIIDEPGLASRACECYEVLCSDYMEFAKTLAAA